MSDLSKIQYLNENNVVTTANIKDAACRTEVSNARGSYQTLVDRLNAMGNAAKWFAGTVVSGTGSSISATVPGANVNDMYLNSSSGNVYTCTATDTWSYQCNIKGPQGSTGATGATGRTSHWYVGTEVTGTSTSPSHQSTAHAVQYDMYLNNSTGNYYSSDTGTDDWVYEGNLIPTVTDTFSQTTYVTDSTIDTLTGNVVFGGTTINSESIDFVGIQLSYWAGNGETIQIRSGNMNKETYRLSWRLNDGDSWGDWYHFAFLEDFGTAATKDSTTSITSGGTGLPTSGAVYTALTNGTVVAGSLSSTSVGSASRPVYIDSNGVPQVVNRASSTTGWFDVVPYVADNGSVEIGRYLDFHGNNTGGDSNYDVRIEVSSTDSSKLTISTSNTSNDPQLVLNGGSSVIRYSKSSSAYGDLVASSALSSSRTWTLPNATGTIALTSDIPSIPTFGTAATKDVPTSGNASSSQVVMGNDTRLTDSRKASDVYSWAKASSKPSYSYSEISGTPTLGTAAEKNYTTSVTSGSTNLVTSGAVYTKINNLSFASLDYDDYSISVSSYTWTQYTGSGKYGYYCKKDISPTYSYIVAAIIMSPSGLSAWEPGVVVLSNSQIQMTMWNHASTQGPPSAGSFTVRVWSVSSTG